MCSPVRNRNRSLGLYVYAIVALVALLYDSGRYGYAGVQTGRRPATEEMNAALEAAIKALDIAGIREAIKAGADPSGRTIRARVPPVSIVAAVGVLGTASTKELSTDELELLLIDAYAALLSGGASLSPGVDLVIMHASKGQAKVIQFLVSRGVDPKAAGDDGTTPLLEATYYGHTNVIDVLHSVGVPPFSDATVRQIRLLAAVGDRDLDSVKRLISQGVDVDAKDPVGRRALAWAITRGGKNVEAMVRALLEAGANPNLTGRGLFGWVATPLHMAVQSKELGAYGDAATKESVITLLLESGAYVSSSSESVTGKTPLHIAAEENDVSSATLLLNADAKVMPRDKMNRTPLELAESGEMIRLLKAYGAVEN